MNYTSVYIKMPPVVAATVQINNYNPSSICNMVYIVTFYTYIHYIHVYTIMSFLPCTICIYMYLHVCKNNHCVGNTRHNLNIQTFYICHLQGQHYLMGYLILNILVSCTKLTMITIILLAQYIIIFSYLQYFIVLFKY